MIICALMVRAVLLSHTNTERLINTSERERERGLSQNIHHCFSFNRNREEMKCVL